VNIYGSISKDAFPTGFGPGVTATFHRILDVRYVLDTLPTNNFTALLKGIIILAVELRTICKRFLTDYDVASTFTCQSVLSLKLYPFIFPCVYEGFIHLSKGTINCLIFSTNLISGL
jgi:hypothetical protein